MTKLSDLIKQLRADDWLTPLYESYQDTKSEPERWVPPRTTVTPSGAGSNCPLDIQYNLLGHRTETPAKNRERMANGVQVHDRVTANLKLAGLLRGEGALFATDHDGTRFEADVICVRPGSHMLHVGEIKSMNEWRFKKVPAQVANLEEMCSLLLSSEAGYTRQLVQYIDRLQRVFPDLPISDEGFMFFENTNTQEYKIRWLKPAAGHRKDAYRNANIALEATRRGELLEPPFNRASPQCRGCYRKRLCFTLQDDVTREGPEWEQIRQALRLSAVGQSGGSSTM